MEDVIRLLPDSVANQIAAGEVIQQPSSVIKELVENSIDAGATKIDIYIKDAGRTLIQVIDNGKGMSPTDARLAFERHSTSKIRQAADLYDLTTMGFRGEALASIAAVAQLEVTTMPHDASVGTRLMITASRVEDQSQVAASPGTNIMVKNIFFNLPARRKFLKKDTVEFSHILREFERLALVNPNVDMSLFNDDNPIHQLYGSNLKTRISELFGRSVEENLVSIGCNTNLVNINGFIGTPSSARKRGALQYLFVNGRNMKHPYFRKAILNCYENLIAGDSQPNFFINFEVDPHSIDVNIHPTKNEIKFEDEAAIWQILLATVKESLGKYNLGPSLSFDNPIPIELTSSSLRGDSSASLPSPNFSSSRPAYNPFRSTSENPSTAKSRQEIKNWERAYIGNLYDLTPNVAIQDKENRPIYLQVGGKYIVIQKKDGLILVDQRRAHLNVLYNDFIEKFNNEGFNSQQLLFTSIIELDSAEETLLENILDVMEQAGFRLEKRRPTEWELLGVPSALQGVDAVVLIKDILGRIIEETATEQDATGRLKEIMALTMARSKSITYGQTLTVEEMDHVISSLFALPEPLYDPKGRKVLRELSTTELDNYFVK